MTDFSRGFSRSGYKNRRGSAWGSTIAVVIVVVLSLVAAAGLAKTFGKHDRSVAWDGASSFATAFSSNPNVIFVFQKDPKRAVFLQLGNGLNGNFADGQTFVKNLSVALGVPINNYVEAKVNSMDDAKKALMDFSSIMTPVKILTVGWGNSGMGTNISRIDALKLWWQIKSIRANDVKTVTLAPEDDSTNSKVLGTTSDYLNQMAAPYFENLKVVSEDISINIVNKSGQSRAPGLAADFVLAVGGRVGDVSAGGEQQENCNILTNRKNSYSVKYLAKLFSCDIKDTAQDEESPFMTVEIGASFADKYL